MVGKFGSKGKGMMDEYKGEIKVRNRVKGRKGQEMGEWEGEIKGEE